MRLIYRSRDLAKQSIFQYIEEYYNNQRMHSSIDYRTPAEVELVGDMKNLVSVKTR